MMELLEYLDTLYPMPDDLRQQLTSILKSRTVKRKEFLLRKGNISKEICFIEKGLVRCYYMLGDKDITAWFMKEGDVVVSIHSFFGQQPSQESIQALEDCTVHYISYEELESLYQNYLPFNVHGRKVLTYYYQLSEQRAISMRSMKARDRYALLLEHEPWTLQRVPRKYISSYLGVTEATLSHIRSLFRKR